MKVSKAFGTLIATATLVSALSLPSGDVSASYGVEDYEVDDTLVYNNNYGPVLQQTSIGDRLLNGEVSPMYVPIPYTYLYTTFYSRTQVGNFLKSLSSTANATNAATAVLGTVSLPISVARPIAIGGYMVSTSVQNRYMYFKEAYDQGYGLQLIVRKNPSYNGYNAATLAEWVKTNTRMR